ITVNALGPTVFRSPLTQWMFEDTERANTVRKGFLTRVPKGRLGEPSDLAGPLLFLASKASDFYTGHILYADGGYTAGESRPLVPGAAQREAVRCRTGTVMNAEFETFPDQRCITSCCSASGKREMVGCITQKSPSSAQASWATASPRSSRSPAMTSP